MIFHKMKYTFKYLFKSKMLLFWTFVFPLILGSCFYLAFKDIEKNEALHVFNIAIIDTKEFMENKTYKKTFEYLSNDSEDKLFNIEYLTKEKAEEKLDNEEIIGYLEYTDSPQLVFKKNGINQTIFKKVVDEINSNSIMINDFMTLEISQKDLINKIKDVYKSNNYSNNITGSNISYTMIEYYTLIAMAALYAGVFSIEVLNNEMASSSVVGKRNVIAPVKKTTSIIGSLIASYIVGLIGMTLLFLFTIFILHVSYGDSLFKVILMGVIGTLAGTSLGILIGSFVKGSSNTRSGILIAVTMAGSFFSGMMGITMKYVIDTNMHIINLVNPSAMITDGLYAIYYYPTSERFYFNICSLLIFSLISIILSVIRIRRVKYECI